MLFLTFNKVNIQFAEKKLTWRSYTSAKALSITKQVEIINKKKFGKTVLNIELEIFVMYVSALEAPLSRMTIHFSRAAQIIGSNLV